MNDYMLNNKKIAAYFIWEYAKEGSALDLWYCAEDIASYLERKNYLAPGDIEYITKMDKYSAEYIGFIRHIAYRLHIYTNRTDELANWFDAENLCVNGEWVSAVTGLAKAFADMRGESGGTGIKNETVRDYYAK